MLCPEQCNVLAGRQGPCPFFPQVVVVCLLSQMLWRQYLCWSVWYEGSSSDDHHVDQALVVFDVPFNRTPMGGICMPLDAFHPPVHPFGWLNEILFVIGYAC